MPVDGAGVDPRSMFQREDIGGNKTKTREEEGSLKDPRDGKICRRGGPNAPFGVVPIPAFSHAPG